jgi:hypothetical protein
MLFHQLQGVADGSYVHIWSISIYRSSQLSPRHSCRRCSRDDQILICPDCWKASASLYKVANRVGTEPFLRNLIKRSQFDFTYLTSTLQPLRLAPAVRDTAAAALMPPSKFNVSHHSLHC